MKKLILFGIAIALFACKGNEPKEEAPAAEPIEVKEGPVAELSPAGQIGKEIFEGKGNCFSCHKPEDRIIGPSIQEIARIYAEKNASITDFLQEKSAPIVDPSQYEVMKTNFAITKNMSAKELKALEAYMMSFM